MNFPGEEWTTRRPQLVQSQSREVYLQRDGDGDRMGPGIGGLALRKVNGR